MTNDEFMIEVENSHNRSKKLLIKKTAEYTLDDEDRLDQFYRLGAAQSIRPTEALVGLPAKRFTLIADMTRNPGKFSLKRWNEKLTDLRNYTYLLDALVRDIEVE